MSQNSSPNSLAFSSILPNKRGLGWLLGGLGFGLRLLAPSRGQGKRGATLRAEFRGGPDPLATAAAGLQEPCPACLAELGPCVVLTPTARALHGASLLSLSPSWQGKRRCRRHPVPECWADICGPIPPHTSRGPGGNEDHGREDPGDLLLCWQQRQREGHEPHQ
jgi:hypothetical protein